MSNGVLKNSPFFLGNGVVGLVRDDVHRHEANYLQVVHVDYHDYD